MIDWLRHYERHQYLTPGAGQTVERIVDVSALDATSTAIDVASGKGEAACVVSERTGCRVLAVDLWDVFFPHAAARIVGRQLADRVALVRADGKNLPVRSATVSAAYCIGGPSIVGLEACLGELARVVKAGGTVVVSDIVWRRQPGALGREWKYLATMRQITVPQLTATIEDAGLEVEETVMFGLQDWREYHAPMLEVAREAKESGRAEDVSFAEKTEQNVAMEQRAVECFFDYAMFVARKPA
jgi:SAM-dependent methyltransferase